MNGLKKNLEWAVLFCCINFVLLYFSGIACAEESISNKKYPDFTDFPKGEPITSVLLIADRINDPFTRSEALLEICSGYLELGDQNKTKAILSKILDINKGTPNQFSRAIIISEVVARYLGLGENDKALEITKSIEFPDTRAYTLLKISASYIEQKQFKKALELIANIDELYSRTLALHRLKTLFCNTDPGKELVNKEREIEKSTLGFKNTLGRISFLEDKLSAGNQEPIFFTADPIVKKTSACIAISKSTLPPISIKPPGKFYLRHFCSLGR